MKLLAVPLLLGVACTCAAAAGPVRVSPVGKPGSPVAGKAWTLRLAVRPASYGGAVRVTASGPKRLAVGATGRRGSYRARLVFPSAGRWTLAARAGATTSRLGVVRVRPAPPRPVVFTEPTSIDVEPAGTLLLVENSPGRLLRVDPATGRVAVLVSSIARAYAVARAPSGAAYVTAGNRLLRIEGSGAPVTIVDAGTELGPVAVAPNGDVYYTTTTQVVRLVGGSGAPSPVVSGLGAPHGLTFAADGSLLISDTGNDRVLRVAPGGAVTVLAQVGSPRGIDAAADGTVSVVDSRANRVVRLTAAGARIGFLGPTFGVPYALQDAGGGAVYLLEAGPAGYVRRIAADGRVTTVSRR